MGGLPGLLFARYVPLITTALQGCFDGLCSEILCNWLIFTVRFQKGINASRLLNTVQTFFTANPPIFKSLLCQNFPTLKMPKMFDPI